MDLVRLRTLIDRLIDELGEDSPVAVFLFTTIDVGPDTISPEDAAKILRHFQHHYGDPPLSERLVDELEALGREMISDGSEDADIQ